MIGFLGNMLVISPQFVVSLWVVAVAFSAVALRRWQRRRWSGRAVMMLLTVALVGAAVGDAVNAHYQYLPRVADVISVPTWPTAPSHASGLAAGGAPPQHGLQKRYPRGAVVEVGLPGPRSGFGTHRAMVYLPPQYFAEPLRRFPVVYLVHGSPGAPVDWFRAARAADVGLAAAHSGHPVVMVAPRASRFWSDDSECVDGGRGHVATYLTVDVPRAVDRMFRSIPDREHRALAGNSAGGFCALNLGLRHQDTFSVLLDLSGFDRPTYAGGLARLYGTGGVLSRRAGADTPARYARALPSTPRMHIWLDYGRADAAAGRDQLEMARLLQRARQDVILHGRRGGHDYGVWRPALRQSVLWAVALLQGPSDSVA